MKKIICCVVTGLAALALSACTHTQNTNATPIQPAQHITETEQTNPIGAPSKLTSCREIRRQMIANKSNFYAQNSWQRSLNDQKLRDAYEKAGCEEYKEAP